MSLPLLGLGHLTSQVEKLVPHLVVLLGRSYGPVPLPVSLVEPEPPYRSVHDVADDGDHWSVRRHSCDPEEGLEAGCGPGHVVRPEEGRPDQPQRVLLKLPPTSRAAATVV